MNLPLISRRYRGHKNIVLATPFAATYSLM
jgi:hypothetical protein